MKVPCTACNGSSVEGETPMSSGKMRGDASGRVYVPDNEAYITCFGKMECNSPNKNFAFMTCSGAA